MKKQINEIIRSLQISRIVKETKKFGKKKKNTIFCCCPEEINFAGLYGCEVSMEAPSYSTAFDSKVMSVAVLPHQDPALEGLRLRTHYDVGDVLTVNCTSAPSFPPASLSFLLNHKEVCKFSISHEKKKITKKT